MAATLTDFTTTISETVGGGDLKVQWPAMVRAVQSLTLYFQGKVANGTEPNDVLSGIRLGADLQSVNRNDIRLLAADADTFKVQENTGTEGIPVWTDRLSVDGALLRYDATSSAIMDLRATVNQPAHISYRSAGAEFFTAGINNAQHFTIEASGNDTVVIEPLTAANALFIDADGHVGLGRNPNASNFVIDNNADLSLLFDLDAGSTAAQDVTLRWLDRGTNQWALRSASTGSFLGIDSGSVAWMVIEDTVPANSLFIDQDGHVGFGTDPNTLGLHCNVGSTWRFGPPTDTGCFLQVQGGISAGVEREASIDWLDKSGVMQWRFTKSNADPANLFIREKGAAHNVVTIESGAGANALYIESTGNIGFGVANPTNKLQVVGNNIRLDNGADATAQVIIDSGSTVAQLSQVSFVDRNVARWEVRKTTANGFDIRDANAGTITFAIAASPITNAIQINGTGIGFFNTTPAAQSAAYTVTNLTTDRTYDANATTTAELADVLGTLIADLQLLGLIG